MVMAASFLVAVTKDNPVIAHDFGAMQVFLVSTFTASWQLVGQKLVVPLVSWYESIGTSPSSTGTSAVVVFDRYCDKIISSNMKNFILAQTTQQTSNYLVSQAGKQAFALFNAHDLVTPPKPPPAITITQTIPKVIPPKIPAKIPAIIPATIPDVSKLLPVVTTAAGVGYSIIKDTATGVLALSSLSLTAIGTLATIGGTLYLISTTSKKRKRR
jgi:hypothetical protein